MSEASEDKLSESVLNFYEQLSTETCTKVRKSRPSTLFLSEKPSKSLKVNATSVNLNKPIEKIAQKRKEKKKLFKQKKQKSNPHLKGNVCPASIIQALQKSNVESLKLDVSSANVNKTIDKITQEKKERKKLLKQKKQKTNPHLKLKADCPASSMQASQKSNVDLTSAEENEYLNILKGMDDLSELSFGSKKLYISCKPQDDGSLLVTLFPNSKIYLIGYYALQVILGDVSVLGYKFKKNEKRVIYSPASHSILPINSLDGCEAKKFDSKKIKDLCIPFEYIQDLDISIEQPVVIVKLFRYCSNITKIFDESHITGRENKLDMCLWKETLGVQLVEDEENCRVPILCESEEWTSYIEEIQTSLCSIDKRIFIITGGKSVGKSTFLRYITNRFLDILEVPRIACIDLDPGQSEFSLPGCLTLSVCSSPLLGPSFSHHENQIYLYQKQILLGDVTVNCMMDEYLSIGSYLFSIYLEKFSDLPLIVNTVGYTVDVGYDIMIDVLRIFEPTHVINIESLRSNENYPTQLTSEIVSSTKRGGIFKNNFKNLNYNLTTFKSVSKGTKRFKSKIAREINIMGYLSLLWKEKEENLTCYTIKTPVIINSSRVAIHIHRSSISPSRVLFAIDGSLVALCSLGKEFLYRVNPYHPLQIRYNISSLLSCVCLGWGVVRGVDPISQEINISTPLGEVELKKVNVVAMPNVQLPASFQNYFSTDTPRGRKR